MAERNTRKLSPKVLQEDLDAFAGLQGLTGYAPANSDYSIANGLTIKTKMQESQAKDVQDKAISDASRDAKVLDEWTFHDYVRNAKQQVKAQFGENSDEVQSVGLKKKSEYKNPAKSPPTP